MPLLQLPSPPPQPVQVLPWLQQPLTTLLWPALAVCALIVLFAVLRTRRSPDRFPLSPRWLTVAAILWCALFASLSYGVELIHPAALYAAPVFILVSVLLARSAWHAPDDRQPLQSIASPVAAAAMLTTGSLLLGLALHFYDSTYLNPNDRNAGLHLGLGVGEAVAFLLPAVGAGLIPLALLPPDHPRTHAVRRAITLFVGFLTIGLAATVAASAAAMTTPLPYESPLADRYLYLNALVAVPAVIASLCTFGVFLAVPRQSPVTRATLLLLAAVAAFPLLHTIAGAPNLRAAFAFEWWRLAACLLTGVAFGVFLGPLTRFPAPLRFIAALIALVACGLIAGAISASAATPYMSLAGKAVAVIGLFAACAAGSAKTPGAPDHAPPPLALVLIALCILPIALTARIGTLRSQLTYQATRHSQAFKFDSLPNTTPEFRREMRITPHTLHMGAGDRWSWVMPQSTWWTRDKAWRDGVIITDRTKPRLEDTPATGPYYRAEIANPDGTFSDISFTDAPYVKIVQHVPDDVQPATAVAVVARQATIDQLFAWARFSPSNSRVWLGVLLGLSFAWWLTRPTRTLAAAAAFSAVMLLATGAALGIGGGMAFLLATTAVATISAPRRDDQWRTATVVTVLMGTALALSGLLLRLGDLT